MVCKSKHPNDSKVIVIVLAIVGKVNMTLSLTVGEHLERAIVTLEM
jgi:hypothetical protein